MKPSDIKNKHPFASVARKSECETIARNIVLILAINGDTWRELTFDEYSAVRLKDNASERDLHLEKPYFEWVLPYTVSEEKARSFSKSWDTPIV